MREYGDHLRILVYATIALVALFLFSSLARLEEFVRQVFLSIMLLILVILILARFGGDLGRTH